MVELAVNVYQIDKMCRLCLSTGVTLLDIFQSSKKSKNIVADLIMQCAPVKIKRCDEMPNFICRSCNTKLEKNHQFQTQIVQSEKTLRRYLQQLRNSDTQIKTEYSEDFHDINADNTEKSLISTECADDKVETLSRCEDTKNDFDNRKLIEDIDASWKGKEHDHFNSENKVKEEATFSFGIKDELIIDDNSLNTSDRADASFETFSQCYGNENSCQDPKLDIEGTSGNFGRRFSADITEDFDLLEEENKDTLELEKAECKKKYKCDLCNKRFACPSALNTHYRTHTGEKPFECEECNKCFALLSTLKSHKRTHTEEKPFQCDVCDKQFSEQTSLKRHKYTHTGEKRFMCDVCSKRFIEMAHLNNHKRTHTGEKPYQCDVCNKYFAYIENVTRHKRTHTGEKPYKCDVCNKQFVQSQHLKNHKLTHTGEKRYECDLCNKRFARLCWLKMHQRTHTGERPYECDVCKKRFINSRHLSTHKRIHTGEKPYRCDVCNMCFTYSYSLKKHKTTHS